MCLSDAWTGAPTLTGRSPNVPVTKVMFLEGLAGQREDVQKGPECGAGVT